MTKIDEKCSLAMNPENSDAQYFGHEIVGILNLVDRVLKHENLTGETELADFEHLTDTVANIGSSILANPRTWRQLSTVSRLLSICQNLNLNYANALEKISRIRNCTNCYA